MKKNVGIATGIGIAIIIGVILFQVNQTMWKQVSVEEYYENCLLYTSPSPRDLSTSRMPSSA